MLSLKLFLGYSIDNSIHAIVIPLNVCTYNV